MKQIVLTLIVSLVYFAHANSEIDKVSDVETQSSMQKWLDGNFGLKPHHVNYMLPFSYRYGERYRSQVPTIEYQNKEAELQVSLKLKLFENMFGLKERYYVAYTQKAFWQFYAESSPFRESLYNPEAFVEFPISDKDSIFGLRSLTFGYSHESNGQPDTEGIKFSNSQVLGNLSKSINYLYLKLRLQHSSLITDFSAISPISDLSDNPDIMDYRGYTKLKFTYFLDDHMFTLMGRGNFETLQGAAEATYSYPIIEDVNFYVKVFSGYGESLIDYNNNFSKYSVGFSFSR